MINRHVLLVEINGIKINMPRCTLCIEYSDSLVYSDKVDTHLICEDCAQNIDKVENFLNTFNPEDYNEESEKWNQT